VRVTSSFSLYFRSRVTGKGKRAIFQEEGSREKIAVLRELTSPGCRRRRRGKSSFVVVRRGGITRGASRVLGLAGEEQASGNYDLFCAGGGEGPSFERDRLQLSARGKKG